MNKHLAHMLVLFAGLSLQQCDAQSTYPPGEQHPAIVNLNACQPVFPAGSIRRGEHGLVKMELTISPKGRVVGSRILVSTGFRELDAATLSAILHCTFVPGYRNGKPIQAMLRLDYNWVLQN